MGIFVGREHENEFLHIKILIALIVLSSSNGVVVVGLGGFESRVKTTTLHIIINTLIILINKVSCDLISFPHCCCPCCFLCISLILFIRIYSYSNLNRWLKHVSLIYSLFVKDCY